MNNPQLSLGNKRWKLWYHGSKDASVCVLIDHSWASDHETEFDVRLWQDGVEHIVYLDKDEFDAASEMMEANEPEERHDAWYETRWSPKTARNVFEVDVLAIVEDARKRWDALKLIVNPSIPH